MSIGYKKPGKTDEKMDRQCSKRIYIKYNHVGEYQGRKQLNKLVHAACPWQPMGKDGWAEKEEQNAI